MNLKSLLATMITSVALVAPDAFADQQPVLSELTAFEVALDDKGTESYTPATRVDPGAVIEYRLSYENTSDTPLSNFIVNGRIPQAAYYLNHSAEVGQQAVFEARTDDIDWSVPPLMRMVADEAGVLRPQTVPPSEYASLRWRLNSPLAAGEQIEARYRVRVED